jgi:hypothetical protein
LNTGKINALYISCFLTAKPSNEVVSVPQVHQRRKIYKTFITASIYYHQGPSEPFADYSGGGGGGGLSSGGGPSGRGGGS